MDKILEGFSLEELKRFSNSDGEIEQLSEEEERERLEVLQEMYVSNNK